MYHRLAGEDVRAEGRWCLRLDIDILYPRVVEDTLRDTPDFGTDNHFSQLCAIAEGLCAYRSDFLWNIKLTQSCFGEGVVFYRRYCLGQIYADKIGTMVEGIATHRVGIGAVSLVISYTACTNLGSRQVEGKQIPLIDKLTQIFDVGTVDASSHCSLDGLGRERVLQGAGSLEPYDFSSTA